MKKQITLLLSLFSLCFCTKSPPSGSEPENPQEPGGPSRKFELYDAMSYAGKPSDLSSMGLLRIKMIYEAHLTKADPANAGELILDMDKIRKHVESASYSGLHMINTDIEDWYSSLDAEEMWERFSVLFAAFREAIPNVQIGNYGIPLSALCVRRFYDENKTGEQALLDQWRQSNRKRIFLAPLCDYLAPSVYIAEPNIESWISDLKITVREIREFEPDKKLLVFIWPQYYDKPESPYFKQFVTPKIWEQMLEAVYEHCNGAIIWSGSLDADGSTIQWADARVQSLMDVTKAFLAKYDADIAKPQPLPPLDPLPIPTAKSFAMYHAMAYTGTPDLSSYGIRRLKVVSEAELVTGTDAGNIGIPDQTKIAAYATAAQSEGSGLPVLINQSTWINDRQTNHAAMTDRFSLVRQIFKQHNTGNPLAFFNVTPASIDLQRRNNSDFFTYTNTWLHYSASLTRDLAVYPDILLPTGHIVDNNVKEWERGFRVMVREARLANPNKPVYAYLCPQYHDSELKPIAGDTWFRMLIAAYSLCDGMVIASYSQNTNQTIQWSENLEFWKATKDFLNQFSIVN